MTIKKSVAGFLFMLSLLFAIAGCSKATGLEKSQTKPKGTEAKKADNNLLLLQTTKHPDELIKALIAIAESGTTDNLDIMVSLLNDPRFLKRLAPDRLFNDPGQVEKIVAILEAAAEKTEREAP